MTSVKKKVYPKTSRKLSSNPVKKEEYGVVCVNWGKHKGRIGYYDDDEGAMAMVYFGDFILPNSSYYVINRKHLSAPTTEDLLKRKEIIGREWGKTIFLRRSLEEGGHIVELNNLLTKELELFHEYHYIEEVIYERLITIREISINLKNSRKIFISHSSKDKPYVRRVVHDLQIRGHCLWFDEQAIKVGDSIPLAIQKALKESDYVLIFLSKNSVASNWVEVEWVNKFWDEINNNRVVVIPALIEDCEIPLLLRTKKYANFDRSYNDALLEVMTALS